MILKDNIIKYTYQKSWINIDTRLSVKHLLNISGEMMTTKNLHHQQEHFSPSEMMENAEKYALTKSKKATSTLIALAVMGGLFIGLGFVFYITVTTGNTDSGWGMNRFAGGLVFSLGLILVVITGAELFTSSVLSAIAVANKQISFVKMLGIWGKVYLGNFLGAMLLLALVFGAAMHTGDHGLWGLNALKIAQHKLHHHPIQAFTLGVLCNLLVCLAVWLTFSTANILAKSALMVLPVAMFVSSGFEHSIANLFMVPLGIAIHSFASVEFWSAINVNPNQFADLTISNFIFNNLIYVTLGNIVGGAGLVGLSYWSIFSKPKLSLIKNVNIKQIFSKQNPSILKEVPTMINNKTVSEFMNTNPFILRPEMDLKIALDILVYNDLTGAVVVNAHNEVVGFFSEHDALVELWCEDYSPKKPISVQDLMKTEVISIKATDKLMQLAEYFTIDKKRLYPTTDTGIATHLTSKSVNERAKSMQISKPRVLPVIENKILLGTVTREDVTRELRPLLGQKLEVVQSTLQSNAA